MMPPLSSGGSQVSDLRDEPMKYVYLDIVGFSRPDRPTEIQADIIRALNDLVQHAIEILPALAFAQDSVIRLPTGDGMCIALVNISTPYDIHLQLASFILASVTNHNKDLDEGDPRRFEVRIGVNEEIDILYIDINGRHNVAGAGINLTQRIMNAGDGGHILLAEKVYGTLINRERYRREHFLSYRATVKHGVEITIYQLVQAGHPGLNLDVPTSELERQAEEERAAASAEIRREVDQLERDMRALGEQGRAREREWAQRDLEREASDLEQDPGKQNLQALIRVLSRAERISFSIAALGGICLAGYLIWRLIVFLVGL